jgi:hypothetical protein
MKTLGSIAASLMLVISLGTGRSYAQSVHKAKVNVPFEFSFANRTFPAGRYSFLQSAQHLLVLQDAQGRNLATGYTTRIESPTASSTGKVTFHVVDGQKVFSELWYENDTAGEHIHVTGKRG